ncbi:hypothetical protein LLH03_19555 [bacterium]|nr:hypothetical protein [bacterium]
MSAVDYGTPLTDCSAPTLLYALRSETADYRHFVERLRTLRRLFADHQYEAAQGACDGLLLLARDLERDAVERHDLAVELKVGETGAEEYSNPEVAEVWAGLLEAQMLARSELVTALEIIGDLRAHTTALRLALRATRPGTYDSQGNRE